MCLVSFSKKKDYSSKKKFSTWTGNPVWAYIELTDFCSHKCDWCYGKFPSKDKVYLSIEALSVVLTKLQELGIQQLSIGGGEPTEHPYFKEMMEKIKEYNFPSLHLLTHGDNLDAEFLKSVGVTSVHMNYQGKENHNKIHGSDYSKQLRGIESCLEVGIPLTASVTVGAYNVGTLDDIVSECDGLGFERMRFWETTGVGSEMIGDNSVYDIFNACRISSNKFGYLYSHSYEPLYTEADINVPCIQVSGLGMYIDFAGRLKFCGATKTDMFITDMLSNSSEDILKSYTDYNKNFNCNACEARKG